ncbi:hypothetical protein ACTJK6_00935 [Ralstonia sp. 22086]|jgi:hypothetical protein|uniref:hypothetical protein n=1 Tax=Ralstonia sp. 22086 TaxID=3453870 RepID=UPI003F85B038
MLQSEKFDLDEAVEAYVYANTPNFLEKRLRLSTIVQQLSLLYSSSELATTILEIVKKDPSSRSIEDVSFAYSCLVALFEKDETYANELLKEERMATLKWAADMRPISLRQAVAIMESTVSVSPVILNTSNIQAFDAVAKFTIPTSLQAPAPSTSFFENTSFFKFK